MIKKHSFSVVILALVVTFCFNCATKKPNVTNTTNTIFKNPILPGFYPDPSICKVDGSYYLVNSTFAYFPGIPIFRSANLVNWEQIGNVLNRPGQLNLDGLEVSQGVFAPAIRYQNGVYYITCTIVGGKNNFVVTATDPSGPWSDPVWIPEVEGIDPSLFFDDDDRAYIIYNSTAPENAPLYNGHRTIKMVEFDIEKLQVIGAPIILVNGGTDLSKKPVWIEGPHIYRKNGFYYLLAAEGGTSEQHSEVVFRSRSINGPYLGYSENPILTQRHLPEGREDAITSTGHADIFEDDNGDWWGVFLGCRPYLGNHYNTGRETFMAPVVWKDNWPVFDLQGELVKRTYNISKTSHPVIKKTSTIRYEFENPDLGFEWLFLRTPREKWYTIIDNRLHIKTRKENISKLEQPSFIGLRQQHLRGSISTKMHFDADHRHEKAGLIVFQNAEHFYYICKSVNDNKPVIQLYASKGHELVMLNEMELFSSEVQLRIEAKGEFYDFLFSEENNEWQELGKDVDAKFLSTENAGGFVGAIYGLYTTSLNRESNNTAIFNWVKMQNND